MKIKTLQISTGYNSLYLFYNTKKPYWKKKPFKFIGPHKVFTFDFLNYTIDLNEIFYREEKIGELIINSGISCLAYYTSEMQDI